MRTTVDIPNHLYRQLKARAAEDGTSVRVVILHAVEQVLQGKPKRGQRVTLPLIRSKHPGTLDIDNERIYDLIGFP